MAQRRLPEPSSAFVVTVYVAPHTPPATPTGPARIRPRPEASHDGEATPGAGWASWFYSKENGGFEILRGKKNIGPATGVLRSLMLIPCWVLGWTPVVWLFSVSSRRVIRRDAVAWRDPGPLPEVFREAGIDGYVSVLEEFAI